MINRNYFLLFAIASILELASCTAILSGLYGVKKIKPVDDKIIARYSKKYNIPPADNYELDTTYFSYLASLDTTKYKLEIKNHYQPLQALYFNNSGSLISFHVNCYAGGFPNLKWNMNQNMATFPPKQQAPIDSVISLNKLVTFLKPLNTTSTFRVADYDYVVIVFWNRFMGRQSKRLIRFVQENCKLENVKKVKLIYANTDNLFSRL